MAWGLIGLLAANNCGSPIPAQRLVPVLSFFLQQGRARCCGKPIDRVHPVAELGAAAIGVVSGALPLPFALAAALCGWLLLTLAIIDARHFTLPDQCSSGCRDVGQPAETVPPPVFVRAMPGPAGRIIQYADIKMDVGAMQASRGGRPVKLNATELRLLKLLLEQPERAFTREQLKAAVWGRGVKLDLRTINAYLGRLRRALNANGDANVIRTITGYGYSIDATCSDVR